MLEIGTDIIEIKRIEKSMRNPNFLKYVFGSDECIMFEKKGFKSETIAANFCGKEAFFKSIGTGIRGFGLKNVQILRNDMGKPYFKFSGKILEEIEKNNYNFSVSLSHSKDYAIATVLCYDK